MKILIKQFPGLVLLCAFLFSGYITAEAAPSAKKNFFKNNVNRVDSSENSKTSSRFKKAASLEKSSYSMPALRKAGLSGKKNFRKTEKKVVNSCSLAFSTEGCFTNCLSRYVSPDLVAHCADACGRGDAVTCGSCLGIGAVTVLICTIECGGGGMELPVEPPQSKNIHHHKRNSVKQTRQEILTFSR